MSIFASLEGHIDFDQESSRLEKELGKIAKELASIEKKLSNQGFLSKAPAAVVAQVKEKNSSLTEKRQKLQANLETVRSLRS